MAETSLPEVDFSFTSTAAPSGLWTVSRFSVHEALSELFEAVIDMTGEEGADLEAILGRAAELVVTRASLTRRFQGVVRAVEEFGSTPSGRHVRVRLVPSLWLLSQRVDARIFQGLTAVEVVREVLQTAGLYQGPDELDTQALDHASYAPRECCVQYRESDLAFVMRLLEDEGVTFYVRHDLARETLVLAADEDADAFPRAAPTLDGGPVRVMGEGGATHDAETVRALESTVSLQPTGVTLREWDFTRPFDAAMASPARESATTVSFPSEPGARSIYEYPARAALLRYSERDGYYHGDDLARRAERRFDEYEGRQRGARGAGVVTGYAPGLRTALVNESEVALGPFVLTAVSHEGCASRGPDDLDAPRGEDRYRNAFEMLSIERVFRPARHTPKPVIQGPQTATVMARPGSPDEVCVDAYGRVLVRFHWERPERRAPSQRTRAASCWVRVSQPWAGDGWGVVFNPRVGMEVVVQFLDGDPDRPLVTGCVYNLHNPPPPLGSVVERRTRSTIRTASSPGGDGFNELSFEDAAGAEQVYVHAQRDLVAEVERDREVSVGNDQRRRVSRDDALDVGRDQTIRVAGTQRASVARDQSLHVEGSRSERVTAKRSVLAEGDQEHRVEGDDALNVSGDAERLYARRLSTRVGGERRTEVSGMSLEHVHGDRTVRVSGHHTTVVGAHEAKRSALLHVEGASSFWSSATTEVVSEKDIVLRCGKTMLRLTPERMELIAPEVIVRGGENRVTVGGDKVRVRAQAEVVIGAEKVTVKSQGAAVKLDSAAKVMGSKVQLDQGSIPLDDDPDDPVKVTTIELRDDQGAPIPDQRFVVKLSDGSELTGIVNHEGVARIELDASATIVFPDLNDTERE